MRCLVGVQNSSTMSRVAWLTFDEQMMTYILSNLITIIQMEKREKYEGWD